VIRSLTLLALVAAWALSAIDARAAETLRVGKAVPEAFSFTPLDIGIRKGIFKQNGLDITEIASAGDAKLQQAMASNSIDIGIGSGPGLAFIVKGSPVKGVAEMAGPPLLLAIVVRPDGPKTVADLKGKKISVSTAGSLTYWLVSNTSRRQGWGPTGITILPMGAMVGQLAALRRHEIDGIIMDVSTAYDLVKKGDGRILVRFGDLTEFVTHVIFATNTLIATRPDTIRAFLKGWFETIAFMRANKAETVAIDTQVLQKDADVMSRTYDDVMPMFTSDGHFNRKGLEVLAKSFVDLHTLPTEPDMSKLYTEAFLPPASK
jgi:ABC-type nitrate/sulfonate/bicarbonate transport system substrate-binding protein